MEFYEIEGGAYQVDADTGSFVFAPSRFASGSVELREVFPEGARGDAGAVLAAARACGLPI